MTDVKKPRKKDDELLTLFIITVLGFGVLIAVDKWYSDWDGMYHTFWHIGKVIAWAGHLAAATWCAVMFINWKDPNYDKVRHWFWVTCLLTIIYICCFKAALNENKAVMDDSNKAKQENSK